MKRLGEIFDPETGPLYPCRIVLEGGYTYRQYREALLAAVRQIEEEALSKVPEEGKCED